MQIRRNNKTKQNVEDGRIDLIKSVHERQCNLSRPLVPAKAVFNPVY
jgi:hypothetical protein